MIDMMVRSIIPAAMSVLPSNFDTPAARAMLIAIGLQESKFEARQQRAFGPARGFWQFEKTGLRGILDHRASRPHLDVALHALCYSHLIGLVPQLHTAIEHNDVLACVCARVLLRTLPAALPGPTQPMTAWAQYLAAWNPGKPHPQTWPAYYFEAWDRVAPEKRT
jgi:hypothetical protein